MDLAATGTVNTRSTGMARATSLGSTSLVALSPRPPPEQFFGVGKIWEDLRDIYIRYMIYICIYIIYMGSGPDGPDGPGFADIRIMISRNKMRFHDLSESNLEDGL